MDAEKSLLLILSDGSYFIRKNGEDSLLIHYLDKTSIFFPVAQNLSQHHHQTLLDGEFQFNYFYNRVVFYVHDAICVNGQRIAELPLTKRLEAIRELVISPLRRRFPDETNLPFNVLGKEYLPFDKLQTVFSAITCFTEDGVRFVYENGKRYNENKGLTFVSESMSYNPASRLEWVWPELDNVTFQVSTATTPFTISLLFPDATGVSTSTLMPYRHVSFSSGDCTRILADLGGLTEGQIICSFLSGTWSYHCVTVSQPVTHVMDLLEYLQRSSTIISKLDLEKLAERSTQRRRGPTSPSKSVSQNTSPTNFEFISESPVEKASSPITYSHKRSAEEDVARPDQDYKRPRLLN